MDSYRKHLWTHLSILVTSEQTEQEEAVYLNTRGVVLLCFLLVFASCHLANYRLGDLITSLKAP